jgi:predicted metal-binding membrane protein
MHHPHSAALPEAATGDRRTVVAGAVIVGAAWLVLAVLSLAGVYQHASHDVIFGHDGAQLSDVAVFAVLWTLMVIAMMLPTALVALAAGSHPHPGPVRLPPAIAANTTVWGLFGLALLAADGIVHRVVHAAPVPADAVLPVLVLAAAGLYQLLPVKRRFQAAARRANGPWQHTLACLGSRWALMTVMFALGTGSLLWMAVLTAVMLVEQFPAWGDRAATAGGVALFGAGLLVAAV